MQSSFTVAALFFTAAALLPAQTPDPNYTGPEVCAKCHKDIAATQATTAMANTWKGAIPNSLSPSFDQKKSEGPAPALQYEVRRKGNKVDFSVTSTNTITAPVEDTLGGKRHGISFLVRITNFDNIPLIRPTLIEARYALSPKGDLVLSPGFDHSKPTDVHDLLGRTLSPTFEHRCLTCHAQPGTLAGAHTHGGVGCESCHGPARAHVDSMQGHTPNQAPIKPDHLTGPATMEVCAQCHIGLSTTNHSDPVPLDVLVSSQVPALTNSECFKQTAGAITCTDCHNPHNDATPVAQKSEQTCLGCHSQSVAKHAAICPVNAKSQCLTCHMPGIDSNGFRLTDHWIGVHPEQGIKATTKPGRSEATPISEYLEILATTDTTKTQTALHRVQIGDNFYDIAHELSEDATAGAGGFTGEMKLADMDPHLAEAAAHLAYGETSDIIQLGNRYLLLHRLPRDFKRDANRLYEEAVALHTAGNTKAALEKDQAALKLYPYFLRALVFMGTTLGESQNAREASAILAFAVQSYPQDAIAQFDLGLTLGAQPTAQIAAFRRAIELDPDMTAAYESLGAALASTGQMPAAIDTFKAGLTIDPLSAILNFDLGLALKAQGDQTASQQSLALAAKLDPQIAARLKAAQNSSSNN